MQTLGEEPTAYTEFAGVPQGSLLSHLHSKQYIDQLETRLGQVSARVARDGANLFANIIC